VVVLWYLQVFIEYIHLISYVNTVFRGGYMVFRGVDRCIDGYRVFRGGYMVFRGGDRVYRWL